MGFVRMNLFLANCHFVNMFCQENNCRKLLTTVVHGSQMFRTLQYKKPCIQDQMIYNAECMEEKTQQKLAKDFRAEQFELQTVPETLVIVIVCFIA